MERDREILALQRELEPYKEQLDLFVEKVRQHWPDWDYHNFPEHGMEAIWGYMDDVVYERFNGLVVPTVEVVGGILSMAEHDLANHWGKPNFLPYMEWRSASVGSGYANQLDFPGKIIKQKNIATYATRPYAEIKLPIEKRARRSDVGNFAWQYGLYKGKSVKVWREAQKYCREEGAPVTPFSVWVKNSKEFVEVGLFGYDLAYGEFDRGPSGRAKFTEKSLTQFNKLQQEVDSPNFEEPELEPLAA